MGGRIALLIGNGSFRDGSLPQLDSPASDVRELAALLRDPYVAGFDPVIELVDATTQQIGREIAHTLDRRRKEDLVLVYYSGFVLLDDEGQLHLAGLDTELDLLSPTSISAAFVASEMDRSRSRRQVLMVDVCLTAGLAHGVKAGTNDITAPIVPLALPDADGIARAFQGDGYGRLVIAACDGAPFVPARNARPLPRGAQPVPRRAPAHPGFGQGLVQGLRGPADSDGDGRICLDELYDYGSAHLAERRPEASLARAGDLPGDLPIGYTPARPSSPAPVVTRIPRPGALVSDRYRLLEALDEGRGALFSAVDERTERRVSIKCLRPPESIDANALERFLREAQTAGAIDHPNVVAIQELGFEGSTAFLVLEPLEGESLASMLRRKGRLETSEALEVLLPAIAGVEAAHRHGVLHRALCPENVFVNRHATGTIASVKVLGFGVSKGLDRSRSEGAALIGSPHYMPREQVLGGAEVDARADVYAFGVMLYEALTGSRPFEADNHAAVLFKVANGSSAPPRALCPELPAGLEAIVQKAMAKERDDRYGQLEQLRLALQAAAREHGWGLTAEVAPPIEARISEPVARAAPAPTVVDTPSVFERRAPRKAGSRARNWAFTASLVVLAAGALGWLLSDDVVDSEEVVVPDIQPLPGASTETSAATQPWASPATLAPRAASAGAAAPATGASGHAATRAVPQAEPPTGTAPGLPARSPTLPAIVSAEGDRPDSSGADGSRSPTADPTPADDSRRGRRMPRRTEAAHSLPNGTATRSVDAGWLEPVPRTAPRLTRAEMRAERRRERELRRARALDAGSPLTVQPLPVPKGIPLQLPGMK